MAITYDAGNNIITVTGYTEGTPCTFTDIYNEDVANGWGVVSRQCTDQFCFNCYLYIGDGSTATWFADTKKHVLWMELGGYWVKYIEVKANAHFRIGKLVDESKYSTEDGCAISFNATSNPKRLINAVADDADIEVYSSYLANIGGAYRCTGVDGEFASLPPLKIYNSVLNTCALNNMNTTLYNTTITGDKDITGSMGLMRLSGDIDKVTVVNIYQAITLVTYDRTIKNVFLRDYTEISVSYGAVLTLINPDIDTWSFNWNNANGARCDRQYEFDLKVIDKDGNNIDGATVKIWDKDGGDPIIDTTTTSGVIPTQTITRGYYNEANGNTLQEYSPHESRTYKYGKSMLSSKFIIGAKTNWAFTMFADPYITQTTEATVAAYTGITIDHAAETITISSNHTLNEIYDYCQYDMIASTKQLDQTMHTSDGVNFVSEYSFVVNTGITVTATDQKLSMVSGKTYTLSGTAQFTGIIATTTTTRIPVTLKGIVDASRYWVGKTAGMVKIFDGTQSGTGDVIGYYEHTADTPITIRVRKGSASPKYLNYEGIGTLCPVAATFTISQVVDSIA